MRFLDQQILESLASTVCPSCGRAKEPKRTICARCWARLRNKPHVQRDLYRLMGQGYAEAFSTAIEALGEERIYLPDGTRVRPVSPLSMLNVEGALRLLEPLVDAPRVPAEVKSEMKRAIGMLRCATGAAPPTERI